MMGSVPLILTLLFLFGFTYSGNPRKTDRVVLMPSVQADAGHSRANSAIRVWFVEESADAYISGLSTLNSALLMLLSHDPGTLKMARMMTSAALRETGNCKAVLEQYTGLQKQYCWDIKGRCITEKTRLIRETLTRVINNPVLDDSVKEGLRDIPLLDKSTFLNS